MEKARPEDVKTDFAKWERSTLERFAMDATVHMRKQDEAIDQLRSDMHDLMVIMRPTGGDIERMLCRDILSRQRKGLEKYGMTVAENPLTDVQWAQHALEEALDLSVYLKRLIVELQQQRKEVNT